MTIPKWLTLFTAMLPTPLLAASIPSDYPPAMVSAVLSSQKPITTIALGSCFAPQLDQSIFGSIVAAKPDVFMFLGDNVYQSEETHQMNLPHLKQAYGLLAASKSFSRLRKNTPILPIWDDHDFGMNDAGASFKPKVNAEKLFEHVWAIGKDDARIKRDGIYFSRTVGPTDRRIQFILLDTRFFRSDIRKSTSRTDGKKYLPNSDLHSTLLGKPQWQWLEQQLKQPAELRFIASSVQILMNNGQSEGWHSFPHERQRLLNLVKKSSNIILLSGDKHFANFYEYQGNAQTSLIEFTASSMNLPITGNLRTRLERQREPYQSGKAVFDANFGLIRILWSSKTVVLEIRDDNNTVVRSKQVRF